MLRIFSLEPLKPLLFRKPTPFEIGESAESYRLPPVSTIAGMVRTALWEVRNKTFSPDSLVNESSFTGVVERGGEFYSTYNFKWKLFGPYLLRNNKVFYPVPLDTFKVKDKVVSACPDSMESLKQLFNLEKGGFTVDLIKYAREVSKGEVEPLGGKFISANSFKNFLTGASDQEIKMNQLELVSLPNVISPVDEAHIKLSKEMKTLEISGGKGFFYRTVKIMLREGWRIVFGVYVPDNEINSYFDSLNGQVARLGGEGGLVKVREERNVKLLEEELEKDSSIEGRFKLILTGTTVFYDGREDQWYPLIWDRNGKQCMELGKVKYYSLSHTLIGGWDYVRGKPKEMHYGVDAGSVYYYSKLNQNLASSEKLTYGDVVFERRLIHPDLRGIYGSALVGRW